jgi:protease-4
MKHSIWIALAVACALGTHALAQSIYSYTSPYDIQLPTASVASSENPSALLTNPANLTWAGSWDLLFLHEQSLRSEVTRNSFWRGQAEGLFFSFRGFGLGLQYVRPGFDQSTRNYLKYNLAVPLFHIRKLFSVGVGLEIIDPTDNSANPSLDCMIGASLHPLRYLSLGVVGRNLGRARIYSGERTRPMLDMGLAARPLWFSPERLTLAMDVQLIKDVKDPTIFFTAQFEALDWLHLFASVDTKGTFQTGLSLDFLRFGLGSSLRFAHQNKSHPDSVLVSARISGEDHSGLALSRSNTAVFVLDRDVNPNPIPVWSLFTSVVSLWDIEQAIRRAANDRRIDSIFIKVEDPTLTLTAVQELREALATARKAGKKVFFHLLEATNLTYALATAGDAIFIDPSGMFRFVGPTIEALFFKGTLDLLGAKAEFQRVGKYKSAVETFADKQPSESNREVLNSLADEYADQIYKTVVEGRELELGKVQEIVDAGLMTPEQAQIAGLVDGVFRVDEIGPIISNRLGHSVKWDTSYLSDRLYDPSWSQRPTIAILHGSGNIVYDVDISGGIDARKFIEQLSDIREDKSIDAVVVRLDSPGGSGMASDLIWHEIKRLKLIKPVIISMGSQAASGAYYISVAADAIVANSATLTGSLGVFLLMFDLSELYAKVGISKTIIKRGKLADLDTTFRGRTAEEAELLQKLTENFYQGFVQKVAEGRKLTLEQVDKIGQGRVWTGRQAKEIGLVDEIGGLAKAIEIAKQRIGLSPNDQVEIVHYPKYRFSLKFILKQFGLWPGAEMSLPKVAFDFVNQIQMLSSLSADPVLAILPFMLTIH